MKRLILIALLINLTGCFEIITKPTSDAPPPIPEVSATLLKLVNTQEQVEIKARDFESTSLKSFANLGTPAGLRLRIRYGELSVSLVEALKFSRDRTLLQRLLELAQWASRNEVRSEALVTIASFADPSDLSIFNAALSDQDVGVQFAALEALQLWGQEGALEILRERMNYQWSDLLRVFSAQAVLALGDKSGLQPLFELLRSRSWIIRAMAARYLGDYANHEDYRTILTALNGETENDFAAAEMAIATLKLLSKSNQKNVAYSPFIKGWHDNDEVQYQLGNDEIVEVEPLLIVPPRQFISETTTIAQTINNKLVFLIKNRLEVPMDRQASEDPNYRDLYQTSTPGGLALQNRYTWLSVLVAEGLAGTKDNFLRVELSRLAEPSRNELTRATALLSLAYARNLEDVPVIMRALDSQDDVVRFGAMEAIQVGRFKELTSSLLNIAYSDPVPAFRVYAAYVLTTFNEPSGRDLLITNLTNFDWPARAMSYWYLGRYGTDRDYTQILSHFANEQNPFVLADISLAAQRLEPQ